MKILLISLMILMTSSLCALVDYSSEETAVSAPFMPSNIPSAASAFREQVSSTSSSEIVTPKKPSVFTLASRYKKINLSGAHSGALRLTEFQGNFDTPYNVFLDVSYFLAQSDSDLISKSSAYQNGNPVGRLGFNFFKTGSLTDLAALDFYAGAMLPEKKSLLASTRTDKIFGANLTKRFGLAVLGIGAEIRATGKPSVEEEMAIGNITKYSGAIGYQATNDIRLLVEGFSYNIGESSLESRNNRLMKPMNFSYVSPQIELAFARIFSVTLGTTYMTRKPQNQDVLIDAKLLDLSSAFGNSVFASFSLGL